MLNFIFLFFLLRTSADRVFIHKNLIAALGIAQVIFVAGIDATENQVRKKQTKI